MAHEFLIFLDFDGVLHPVHASGVEQFDPRCVQRARQIVTELDAGVVVSSAWRMNEGGTAIERINAWLDDRLVGETPVHSYHREKSHIRYQEIQEYLGGLDAEPLWLAIDDKERHFPSHAPAYISDPSTGLTDLDVTRVVRMARAMIWAAGRIDSQTRQP